MSGLRRVASSAGALAAAALIACGGPPPPVEPPECTDREEVSCACTDGTSGNQTCFSGRWGRCSCAPVECLAGDVVSCTCAGGELGGRACGPDGAFGACGCGERQDGGLPLGDAGTFTPGALLGCPEKVVDFFPSEGGLLVVRERHLELLGDDGAALATVDSPRDLTAASFDGKRLAVADKAILTVYDPKLTKLASGFLNESCASSVIIGDDFVCGPANPDVRNFGTYSLADGALRAISVTYSNEGTLMTPIPGHAEFFTIRSDAYLYQVAGSGAVEERGNGWPNERPQVVGGFDGNPASRWIDAAGHVFVIYGSTEKEFFVLEGDLGLMPKNPVRAMADDGAGALFRLVSGEAYSADAPCAAGCNLQRIDFAARQVKKEISFRHRRASSVSKARWDPFRRKLVVGFEIGGTGWGPAAGSELWQFDLD